MFNITSIANVCFYLSLDIIDDDDDYDRVFM